FTSSTGSFDSVNLPTLSGSATLELQGHPGDLTLLTSVEVPPIKVSVALKKKALANGHYKYVFTIINLGSTPLPGPIALGVPTAGAPLTNRTGTTAAGNPYLVFKDANSVFAPGESLDVTLDFSAQQGKFLPDVVVDPS